VWERAGRLQDACDGSYFNGLPLFTGFLFLISHFAMIQDSWRINHN
jgi:hypothetical protein